VTPFSADAVRALGFADEAGRVAAAERATALSVPTAEQEVWRYSRIAELDLDGLRPSVAQTVVHDPNGYRVDDHDLDTGRVHDLFDELATAFCHEVVVRVPRNSTGQPIVIDHQLDEAGVAVFPRLVVDAEENSEITIVERFTGEPDARSLVVPRLYLRAQQAARVNYLAVNQLGGTVWQLGHQHAVGHRDSTTLLATVALGGDYARVRTDVESAGQGATTRQVAVYFAGRDQMHDFRTLQDHTAPRTNSDLLFKGAVQDRARSVYTGLIRIREEAKGAAAFQTNRNLTLSEGAWAESVPNLDIRTNDVKCSHASTVGPIDEEQRFYLESRGIRPELAERLVVLGFFDEVLDQLPVGRLADELRQAIAAKLGAAALAGVPS
jgi:Fe-S cluster assembly protein SufD